MTSAGFAACALLLGCVGAACTGGERKVLTMSGSMLGREGEVLRVQLDRFRQRNPGLAVELRPTPDAADLRHQLYVQWLNARVSEPDVLQLDVVWTAEFAAAGWIAPLDRHRPQVDAMFPNTVDAHRWRGAVFALPWFVDAGMLYWRTDLVAAAPGDLHGLAEAARQVLSQRGPGAAGDAAGADGWPAFGFVWQGARYEGLVTVFLEHLGAFGGTILDEAGRVRVDDEAAVEALTFMRDSIHRDGIVPPAVLSWQEEQARLAFQHGQAVFMRNWPYAVALLGDAAESAVAGRVAVAPLPGASGGRPTAALGGSALAINAFSDQPDEAYRLIVFLLEPEQMLERARVAGQFPPRRALYDHPALAAALPIPLADARRIIEAAVPRPVTPVYSQLSSMLQVALHRALTGQQPPRDALRIAAREMRGLLRRTGLGPS